MTARSRSPVIASPQCPPGIGVQRRSTLILLGPPTNASGNNWVDLWCGDKESSVDLGANFTGTVDPACTGFND